jgi:hypothetical protein
MTTIKKALLLSVAAAALMAMVGAGSASATVLCKSSSLTNSCSAGDTYGVGEEVKSSLSGTFKFKAGFTVIECRAFALNGVITNAGGEGSAVKLHMTKFGPTSCNEGQTFTLNSLGDITINSTSNGNGSLTMNSGLSFSVKVGSTECTYGGTVAGQSVAVQGGAPAHYEAAEVQIVKVGGGILCASPAKLIFRNTVEPSSASSLYVAQA